MEDIRIKIKDAGYDDTVYIDDFDDALIGLSTEGAAVYDEDLMLAILCNRDGMDPDDALEYLDDMGRWLDYYHPTPVIVRDIKEVII